MVTTRDAGNHNGKQQPPESAEAFGQEHSLSELLKIPLHSNEVELLSELVTALRSMKYGSVVLTVHDGHLVEIETSVRIRKSRPAR